MKKGFTFDELASYQKRLNAVLVRFKDNKYKLNDQLYLQRCLGHFYISSNSIDSIYKVSLDVVEILMEEETKC